jgi:uncharacterized protein (TIGR03437 family)
MLDWLAADLARTKKFWRFVFFHHPAYSMGAYQNDARTRLVRDHLAPILERHGVHIAFHGHEHSYQRSFPISDGNAASTGTLYITTGGGGASLYTVDVGPRTAFALSAHHYLRVSVDGAAATMEAVRDDGQIFDRVDLAPAPRLSNPAVVNAASFVPSVAPGSLVTIFGRDIADEPATGGSMAMELRGVRVTLDGQRLPLSYVSPTQINTQLPYGAFGSTVLRVSTPNGSADAILSLSDTAPAVFLVNGRPAATHADGTLVSPESPAVPGEVISIYVTGLGRVSGVISAGQTAPTRPLMVTRAEVEVEIAGTRVDPHFAGLAPGYAGLYQINVLMPAVRSGDQMLRIHAGPSKSPPVSLAVGSP